MTIMISQYSQIIFSVAIVILVILVIFDIMIPKEIVRIDVPIGVYIITILTTLLVCIIMISSTISENQQVKESIKTELNAKEIKVNKDGDIIIANDVYYTFEYNKSDNQVILQKINTNDQIVIDDVVK